MRTKLFGDEVVVVHGVYPDAHGLASDGSPPDLLGRVVLRVLDVGFDLPSFGWAGRTAGCVTRLG